MQKRFYLICGKASSENLLLRSGMEHAAKNRPLIVLFITVLIDMMGFGIAFPILPVLFHPDAGYFHGAWIERSPEVVYGFIIASFAFAQFIGAPILGALSDRYGRKKILVISLVGSMAGYFLFAMGIHDKNILLLFAGRIIPGFMGGNISIVNSSLADVSDEKDKVRNFGLLGTGYGLGMIIGFAAGGFLSKPHPGIAWFDFATPFYLVALLTLINTLFVLLFLPETLKVISSVKIHAFSGFKNIALAFAHKEYRMLFSVVLLCASGFAFFTNFIAFYFIEKYSFDQQDISLFFGYVSVWTIFTQAFLVRYIANLVRTEKIILISLFVLGAGIPVLMMPRQEYMLYILLPFLTVAQNLYLPNIVAFISNSSSHDNQGKMLGIHQSLVSIANSIPPVIGGIILLQSTKMPLYTSSAFTLLGWFLFLVYYLRKERGE